jgi:hypothetical protein
MAGKAVSWRKDPLIQERMLKVQRRHLEGWSNLSIGAELHVDEATVRNDLKRLSELWTEHTQLEQAQLRAEAVARLEAVRVRALEAYEFDRAMEFAVMTGEQFENDDGEMFPIQRDDKGSAQFRGNKAAALNAARQATMDEAKVLGIIVDKVSPTNPDGTPLDLAELILKIRANAS